MARDPAVICECNRNYPGVRMSLGVMQYCNDCNRWVCLKCSVGHKFHCYNPLHPEDGEYQDIVTQRIGEKKELLALRERVRELEAQLTGGSIEAEE